MSITMYSASVPQFIRMLGNLRTILQKAAAHAEAKKIDPSVLLGARLFPDMFPLTRQVQIATDFARGTGARLAGIDPPSVADQEQSFVELDARIDATITYLRTLSASQIDGSEAREITRMIRGVPKTFTGLDYLISFSLPNLYFHVATAYAILRHNGVDVGKTDYVGTFA
jgi:hypothetical protein